MNDDDDGAGGGDQYYKERHRAGRRATSQSKGRREDRWKAERGFVPWLCLCFCLCLYSVHCVRALLLYSIRSLSVQT